MICKRRSNAHFGYLRSWSWCPVSETTESGRTQRDHFLKHYYSAHYLGDTMTITHTLQTFPQQTHMSRQNCHLKHCATKCTQTIQKIILITRKFANYWRIDSPNHCNVRVVQNKHKAVVSVPMHCLVVGSTIVNTVQGKFGARELCMIQMLN